MRPNRSIGVPDHFLAGLTPGPGADGKSAPDVGSDAALLDLRLGRVVETQLSLRQITARNQVRPRLKIRSPSHILGVALERKGVHVGLSKRTAGELLGKDIDYTTDHWNVIAAIHRLTELWANTHGVVVMLDGEDRVRLQDDNDLRLRSHERAQGVARFHAANVKKLYSRLTEDEARAIQAPLFDLLHTGEQE